MLKLYYYIWYLKYSTGISPQHEQPGFRTQPCCPHVLITWEKEMWHLNKAERIRGECGNHQIYSSPPQLPALHHWALQIFFQKFDEDFFSPAMPRPAVTNPASRKAHFPFRTPPHIFHTSPGYSSSSSSKEQSPLCLLLQQGAVSVRYI